MLMLQARSLSKAYDGIIALKDGSLTCDGGQVCGLLGANGSGKSTFSKIVSGLVSPGGGEILLEGRPVQFKSNLQARMHGIAMVHQNLSLVPELTVWENITLGHESVSRAGFFQKSKAVSAAKEAVEKLCPDLDLYAKVGTLSPSNRQLIEVAKAVCQKPRLLIMDEPTAALELSQVEILFHLIGEWKKTGMAIIFISHRLWEVTRICDFVVVFRDGNTVGNLDFRKGEADGGRILSLITGKTNSRSVYYQKEAEARSETLLEVSHLSVGKIRDLHLSLAKGEIVGVGGLHGQGQEELLLALSGLFPSSGTVSIEGKPLRLNHPREAIRNGIMLVPGDRHKEGLFLKHDVFANLVYPKFSQKNHRRRIPFATFFQECAEIIRSLAITPPNRDKPVRFLSGGNQQKVVVGKWMNLHPRVLLLSDPAKGVDIEAKFELYKVVSQLAEGGTSVLLYASDNEELIGLCDRIVVLFEGRIVDIIPKEQFSEERIVASSIHTETKGKPE